MNRAGFASALILAVIGVAAIVVNLALVGLVARRRAATAYRDLVQLRTYALDAVALPVGMQLELDGWLLSREADRAVAVRGDRRWVVLLRDGRVVGEGSP